MNITKGPWAVDEATRYVHSVENVENGKRMQLICDIVPHKAGRADNRPFTDEMLGNARAIAEVPNLIEALTEARDLLHHTKCHHEDALKCPACSLESRIDDLLKHIEG